MTPREYVQEAVINLSLTGGAAGLKLLAEVTTIPGLETVSNLGAVGLLGLFVWHVLTKTIPNIQETFRQEQAETRREQQLERQLHRETAEKERELFRESINRLLERE